MRNGVLVRRTLRHMRGHHHATPELISMLETLVLPWNTWGQAQSSLSPSSYYQLYPYLGAVGPPGLEIRKAASGQSSGQVCHTLCMMHT